MMFEKKRNDLNRIVREALNGRKDPWKGYKPNLLWNKAEAEARGLKYEYGLGDFVTQKITVGKVAAAATIAYSIATKQYGGVIMAPVAYGLGRLVDGVAFIGNFFYKADRERARMQKIESQTDKRNHY